MKRLRIRKFFCLKAHPVSRSHRRTNTATECQRSTNSLSDFYRNLMLGVTLNRFDASRLCRCRWELPATLRNMILLLEIVSGLGRDFQRNDSVQSSKLLWQSCVHRRERSDPGSSLPTVEPSSNCTSEKRSPSRELQTPEGWRKQEWSYIKVWRTIQLWFAGKWNLLRITFYWAPSLTL